jgi:ParB family chromosome partitioning protein
MSGGMNREHWEITKKLKGLGPRPRRPAGRRRRGRSKEQQRTLPVGRLQPGKYQPRTQMDKASLEELAASIRVQGLMQPILVRPVGEDRYEIIAGERRWRAAQMAGLTEVSTLIRTFRTRAALAMALIENIQREDLNPLEEALGLQRLVDEFDDAPAGGRRRWPLAAGGIEPAAPAATGAPAQELLMRGEIDMGHARSRAAVRQREWPDALQVQLAQRVVQKGSLRSVRRNS